MMGPVTTETLQVHHDGISHFGCLICRSIIKGQPLHLPGRTFMMGPVTTATLHVHHDGASHLSYLEDPALWDQPL